jgi:hypothetical protein
MTTIQLPSASAVTRILLAGLALSAGGLVLSGFLAAILRAAGDSIGGQAFFSIAICLASAILAQCAALLITVAVHLEANPQGRPI